MAASAKLPQAQAVTYGYPGKPGYLIADLSNYEGDIEKLLLPNVKVLKYHNWHQRIAVELLCPDAEGSRAQAYILQLLNIPANTWEINNDASATKYLSAIIRRVRLVDPV
jgi:hypothetical protein